MTRSTRQHPVVLIALLTVLFALVAAACSDGEGGAVVSSLVESGEVTLPEVTAPPASEDPPATEDPSGAETPVPEETTEDNTLAFVLGLVLIVLVAILIGTAIGGRSRKRAEPSGHRDAQATQRSSDVNSLLATASWLHDSASLDLLSASSGEVALQWQNVRSRAADLQTQAAALAMGSGSSELDAAASALSQAAGSFAGAMDGYVSLQTKEGASDELVAEAKTSVMARRQELQRAAGRVTAAR